MALLDYAQMTGNIGLLEARGTGEIFHSLTNRFYAVEFADLCTVAEEIVLRDKIFLVGKWHKQPSYIKIALKPFIDDGVFEPLNSPFQIPNLPRQPDSVLEKVKSAIYNNLTATSITNTEFEAARIQGAEQYYGVASSPLLRQMQYYRVDQKSSFDHNMCDLFSQYKQAKQIAEQMRRRYQYIANLPYINIPPIAVTAFKRSKYFEDVVYEILQLRSDFSHLRKHFAEIQTQLLEPKISPNEKHRIETVWVKRWQKLTENISAPHKVSLGNTIKPLLKHSAKFGLSYIFGDEVAISDSIKDSSEEFANEIIDYGQSYLNQKILRPVHRSVNNYLTTTDEELRTQVSRIFQKDMNKINSDMRALTQLPTSPWMQSVNSNH